MLTLLTGVFNALKVVFEICYAIAVSAGLFIFIRGTRNENSMWLLLSGVSLNANLFSVVNIFWIKVSLGEKGRIKVDQKAWYVWMN